MFKIGLDVAPVSIKIIGAEAPHHRFWCVSRKNGDATFALVLTFKVERLKAFRTETSIVSHFVLTDTDILQADNVCIFAGKPFS